MRIKLKKIKILGFKDKQQLVNVEFSNEQTTTIYGVNGSGKTTLLRIISAIFSKDEKILKEENVCDISIEYLVNDINQMGRITENIIDNKDSIYNWTNVDELLSTSYIYITTDRGLNGYQRKITIEDVVNYMENQSENFQLSMESSYTDLMKFVNKLNNNSQCDDVKHIFTNSKLSIENITIATVEKLVLQYENENKKDIILMLQINLMNYGLKAIVDNEEIELKDNLRNPKEIVAKLSEYKKIIQIIMDPDDGKTLSLEKLYTLFRQYFEIFMEEKIDYSKLRTKKLSQDKKMFICSINFLNNLINLIEENKNKLYAVDNINRIFKEFTGGSKLLCTGKDNVEVLLNSGIRHSLNELSNGERHLLTFLTILGLVGSEKKIVMIDEPGISMDTDWQEVLIERIESMCPCSQVIMTTHSPDLSINNPDMISYIEHINEE